MTGFSGVMHKELGPFVSLQHRRLFQAYTQESDQLKFNTKLAPDKDQRNSGEVRLRTLVGMLWL